MGSRTLSESIKKLVHFTQQRSIYVSYEKHLSLFDRDDDHVNVSSYLSNPHHEPTKYNTSSSEHEHKMVSVSKYMKFYLLVD